ncbi:MAG: NADP-dependent isocitrate dehydrogenase [Phaeodactylibacter sp.]|nr:NADP-dependent isocitrate dehydrogenase [Phaeodactylibacter sp.]
MPVKTSLESQTRSVSSTEPTTITIAYGDGIGREIMEATLSILEAAGAELKYEEARIGEQVYLEGHTSGISPESWEVLRRNRAFLKGPITTPQGGGYKSLNVTIRKALGQYANVRPCRAYTPYVESNFPDMDLVVVRENEEDLYAGIEHQQTAEVVQCLKLVSRPGCERVIRYAFEYARAYGRRKVTCMTKDNIMKHTDGLFHKVFDEVAREYPDIQSDHYIIDIGSALLAARPSQFDVIVTLNLYGDIISDITAQVAGSVGLGGSANIGDSVSMFEAIHGSAPDIAGKGLANPSGLIHAACMMLTHVGQPRAAERIMNALLRTLEDGIHTADLYNETFTRFRANTKEFTQAVIDRLGQAPQKLKPAKLGDGAKPIQVKVKPYTASNKKLVGVDVFLDWAVGQRDPNELGHALEQIAGNHLQLKMITNRGVKVYPNGLPETFCTDHWRCRFVSVDSQVKARGNGMSHAAPVPYGEIVALLRRLADAGLNFIKIENLYEMNGERAYSLGQGE